MNCPKCLDDMILTRATDHGDEYFYCRSCKKELSEMDGILEEVPVFKTTSFSPTEIPNKKPSHYTDEEYFDLVAELMLNMRTGGEIQ